MSTQDPSDHQWRWQPPAGLTPPPAAGTGAPPVTSPGGLIDRRALALVVVATAVLAVIGTLLVTGGSDDPPAATSATATSSTSTTVTDPTATTTPGPSVPPDVAVADPSEVADLAAFVAATRGLEFLDDVQVHLADDDQFAVLMDEVDGDFLDSLTAQAAMYEALGLIPPGTAQEYALELRQRYYQALGFYHPPSDLLVVRRTTLDAGARAVVVHELTHALDDQWLDLDRPEYAEDRASEHVTTFSMALEGDATRVEETWIAAQPPDVQDSARAHVGSGFDGGLSIHEDFADYGFFGPYEAGNAFVVGVASAGGERLVDAVLLDPPETTEQVLFPEVFARRESRIRVPRPPAEGPIVDEGVKGALFWQGLLGYEGSGVAADVADTAVRGWGGDWQVSWEQGDLTCTRIDVVGDSQLDTDELFTALTQWASTRPQLAVSAADGRVRLEFCYQIPPVTAAGDPRQ